MPAPFCARASLVAPPLKFLRHDNVLLLECFNLAFNALTHSPFPPRLSVRVSNTQTMESVCELLTHALEKATMTPTMRLMRQLSEFNPKVPTEVAEMERMMEESFSRDVEFSEFQEDLQYFLKVREDTGGYSF